MSKPDLNVSILGQVFTPKRIVSDMISLIRNHGNILEPSCGNGAFFSQLDNCIGIEIDPQVAPKDAICMDFFDFSTENKFDTIISNPPYVRYQDISLDTKKKLDKTLFDERSNLYLFFIHKCIQHLKPKGELIFIVTRDFLKSTSAIKLNEFIFKSGTITDIIELGDEKIFTNASPNCIIFRFEKDNFSRKTNITQNFNVINGQIFFTNNRYRINFSDIFFVKVGGVSDLFFLLYHTRIIMFDGIFGGLFDFNHDGKIDAFERGAEFAFLHELMKDEDDNCDDSEDSDDWDSDDR